MSLGVDFGPMLAPVRRRAWQQRAASGVPLALAAGLLAWRFGGLVPALALVGLGLGVVGLWAARGAQAFDRRWLLRQLDARAPELEDSTDLLLAEPGELGPLQALQRGRVMARLETVALDLRPDWRWRPVWLAWALALVMGLLAAFWPEAGRPAAAGKADVTVAGPAVLRDRQIEVRAPAHTGQALRRVNGLAVKAPTGSMLKWRLSFSPEADEVVIVYLDGRRLPLVREGAAWTASARLETSALYRLVVDGAEGPLNRLDAVPDAAPVVRVVQPQETVTIGSAGMARWALAFEARDDFGLARNAVLRLVRAEGEGENVRFRESVRTVTGVGPATAKRFEVVLDLAALGIGAGAELVAQLQVRDNRPGGGQAATSASVILRIPGTEVEAIGLEAAAQKAMPAYFRSQRQIIIDIEALLKARPRISAGEFAARANNIGADERILRMRYGKFLGEESEGQPRAPTLADLLTSDGGSSDKPVPAKIVLPEGHDAFDGHDHGATDRAPPQFGSEINVLADYGHAHNDGESATLFDPETRAKLKAALDAMWRTERSLRQAEVSAALPPAREALGLIKDVQQASRVFLARTGPKLPPIDEGRRLGGKREGIEPASGALAAVARADAPAARLFGVLAVRAASADELAGLERWLAMAEVPDRLGVLAAMDAVRGDPACGPCRARLRAALWGAMARPAAQVPRRDEAGVAGRRYLDAVAGR